MGFAPVVEPGIRRAPGRRGDRQEIAGLEPVLVAHATHPSDEWPASRVILRDIGDMPLERRRGLASPATMSS